MPEEMILSVCRNMDEKGNVFANGEDIVMEQLVSSLRLCPK